jgi:hypothetical protein
MSYCIYCGQSLAENCKFCTHCGKSVEKSENVIQKTETEIKNPNFFVKTNLKTDSNINVKTEIVIGGFSNVLEVSQIVSPFQTIMKGIIRLLKGFRTIFKDKKALIAALILAGIWIFLIVLLMLQIESLPIRLLSLLTFAEGGVKRNLLGMITGAVGKGIFAAFFISLFSDGVREYTKGVKSFFASFKGIKMEGISVRLAGMGISLLFYNLIVTKAEMMQVMVGVASFFLILRALAGGGHFIREFCIALVAKKTPKRTIENTEALNSLLSGGALGFVISVLLSMLPFAYTPFILGAVTIIVAIIIEILGKKKKKVA